MELSHPLCRSGSLSTSELRMVLARPTSSGEQSLSDEDIEQIVRTFDVNGDGELQARAQRPTVRIPSQH